MKRMLALVQLMVFVIASPVMAQDAPDPLDAVMKYEFGGNREPLTLVEDMVRAAMANPDDARTLSRRMADTLKGDVTADAMMFICRQLSLIGGPEVVPDLVSFLVQPHASEAARYALERIPGAEVDQALIGAVRTAPDEVKVGILTTLGRRHAETALPLLSEYVTYADVAIATAAADALAAFGTPEASAILRRAAGMAPALMRQQITEARAACAAKMLEAGYEEEAVATADALMDPTMPEGVRVTAFRVQTLAKGSGAVDAVLAALSSDDNAMRDAALMLAREIPGDEATRAFAERLAGMDPAGRVTMIQMLADRGGDVAREAVFPAINDPDLPVRVAAMGALARLGSSASVMPLARIAANSAGDEQEAARKALAEMRGADAAEAITSGLDTVSVAERIELIQVAEKRGMTGISPRLIEWTRHEDAPLRTASIDALNGLARWEDYAALLDALKTAADSDRTGLEWAVVFAARKAPAPSEAVTTVVGTVSAVDSPAYVISVIRVLGMLGDPSGLAKLREYAYGDDLALSDAAIRSIVDWPTAEAIPDLVNVARHSQDLSHRVLAMRACARLLGQDTAMGDTERLAVYRELGGVANQEMEKKALLAGLSSMSHPEAMAMAEGWLGDASVKEDAVAAVLQIAPRSGAVNRERAEEALKKAQAASDTEPVRKSIDQTRALWARFEDFVVAWEIAGPFFIEGKSAVELFDEPFAPEEVGSTVGWRVMPMGLAEDKPWALELSKYIGGDHRVAYARTCLVSDRDQEVVLEMGSDDALKAWLNGEVVSAQNVARGVAPDSDKVKVALKAGENMVLLKVVNGASEWGACMRVRPSGDAPLEGIYARLP